VNIVILNLQRPLWEGDQEVVKRYRRDEPTGAVIHICMEAIQGIYSYLYLKLAKTLCFSYLLYFFPIKSENKSAYQFLPRGWERRGRCPR
jgi:hypothetical protein